MLTLLAGVMVAVPCALLWCVRLLAPAGRRSARWIGQGTETELAQQFVFVSSRRLLGGTVAAVLVLGLAGLWLGLPVPALVVICGTIFMLPRAGAGLLRRKRRQRISIQLPDALQLWAGLLRSGQGMMPALGQLASRQPEPLGAELRLVLGEYRLGVPLDRAMHAFHARVAVGDLRMLVTLLHAHRALGGNLAEALERLAGTLRSRLAMEARIQSLTAQGRLQGAVVGLLPLLLAAVLWFMEPAAMHALFSTAAGYACIAIIMVLETTGYLLIRRIVRIDV